MPIQNNPTPALSGAQASQFLRRVKELQSIPVKPRVDPEKVYAAIKHLLKK